MKTEKIFGFFWLFIAVCLLFILIINMKMPGKHTKSEFEISLNKYAEELYATYTFTVAEINDIDINIESKSVYVETSKASNIVVELYCTEKSAPLVHKVKNVLRIEEATNIKLFNIKQLNTKIVVKVPENFNNNGIDINTVSGSIHCKDLITPVMDCQTLSGSIHFDNCTIESLDIKTASGSVHINDSMINELDCAVQSGSVHLTGDFDKVDVHSISGSIHANLNSPLKSNSEFQSVSGSINLEVPKNSNMEITYSSTSGSYKNEITGKSGKKGSDSIGNNGPKVELKTTSGSVKIY